MPGPSASDLGQARSCLKNLRHQANNAESALQGGPCEL